MAGQHEKSTSDLRKAAFDGMIWGVGGKVLLVAANFAVLMVTSRVLSPAEFGVFAAATIFTDFSWALATSTLGVAMIQKKELTQDNYDAGFFGFLALGLGLTVIMTVGSWPAERILKAPGLTPVLCTLGLFVPFKLLSGFYGAVLQRRLDMRFYQMTQNLPQILGSTGVTIVSAIAGLGVWSLVLGFAAATMLEFCMTVARAKVRPRLPKSSHALKELLAIGSASATNRLTNFVATNADRIIAGVAFGASALGIYARAYSLMMTPVKLLGLAASRVFLPVFSRMQHDEERLRAALEKVLAAQTLIYVPLSFGFVFAAPLLVRVVLGEGWTQVTPAAQLLFIALFARLGYVVSEAASIAVGEAWGAVRRQAAYAAAVVIGGGVGCLFGVVGLAAGVTAALIFFYLLSLRQSCVRFGCSASTIVSAHLRATAIAAACALPALAAGNVHVAALTRWKTLDIPGVVVFWGCYGLLVIFGPDRLWGEAFADLRNSVANVIKTKLPFPSRASRQMESAAANTGGVNGK
jgi:O-antigen/teichoic acid export membrane protein